MTDLASPTRAHADPASVPVTVISDQSGLPDLVSSLDGAVRTAIDTETLMVPNGIGALRVVSIATRHPRGHERAFVVDCRDLDPALLGPVLDGRTADAWNADFDARVLDRAVFVPTGLARPPASNIGWWDAQLADALLHQGRSGFTWYHGLAWATEHYLGVTAEGKGTTQLSFTAHDDLTADQIGYAAADAVETLWVGDVLRELVSERGLERVTELEMGARPFLDHMERVGLPMDWSGWEAGLARLETDRVSTLTRLAGLTGGGQGTLFDDSVEPSWNPASEVQAKEAFNRHETERVRAWAEARTGQPRLLADTDSLRHDVLVELGGPLADTLIEYRDITKVLSTYGENLAEHLHDDGRFHAQYLQVVGTNTGRLASRNPNAQNLSPRLEPHIHPADPDRVFVHADLSQAELRMLAQVSNDGALRQAFREGADIHVSTAGRMFRADMDEIARTDPDRLRSLRAQAKNINFGIAYGQGARALGRSLTLSGVATTEDEARALLDAYLAAYPGVAAWARGRDAEIDVLASDPGPIDWPSTLELHRRYGPTNQARWAYRDRQRRWPSIEELATELGDVGTDPDSLAGLAKIVTTGAAVVLHTDGSPLTIESRTPAGRCQQFTFHLDRILLLAALTAARSVKPGPTAARASFDTAPRVSLSAGPEPLPEPALSRLFEDRVLRRAWIDHVGQSMGPDALHHLLDGALKARVAMLGPAWRNAPIQGGVADVMLDGYHRLVIALADIEGADPVQTVHDSVVVECHRADADRVAELVKSCLEDAMVAGCPDVVARADTDIRTTLSDDDIVRQL
ncbi:MAG: hypothetical protein GY929_18895 [Actinomycetia bacterium]|nr:hypothetical protein [Actinomycetes bacterium]